MKIRNILFACVLAVPVAALAGPGSPPPTDTTTGAPSAKLSEQDTQMIAHLHAVNATEIDLGKLAQQNGTAPVKAYGKELVTDHTAFDAKVISFAKKHGVAMIPEDSAQTPAQKTEMDTERSKLEALKGTAFDQELLPMMASAHQAEVDKIDANISVVGDADLKAMLQNAKPTFQKHADDAKKLQSPAMRSSTAQ